MPFSSLFSLSHRPIPSGEPTSLRGCYPSQRGLERLGAPSLLGLVCALIACGFGTALGQVPIPGGDPQAAVAASDEKVRSSDATREEILAWIAELASGQFGVREEAMRRLSQLGDDQIPLLEGELKLATDAEVRVRLAAVLAKLKYERQQRTIRTFLRDPDMSHDHELHGWASFSRVAGANRSAKRLFLQLGDRYGELVEHALEPGKPAMEWARRVARDIQEDQLGRPEGDKSDGLALLYCLCAAQQDDGASADEDGALYALSVRMFRRSPYNQFLRDPQSKRPMEVMTERWSKSIRSASDQADALIVLLEADLNSAKSIARKMLSVQNGPDAPDPREAMIAIQTFFRYGKQDDIPLLETWLERREVCEEVVSFNFPAAPNGLNPVPENLPRNTSTVELRDVAVLACMQIAAMDYRKYFPRIQVHELRGFVPRTIAEASDADAIRDARIQAWRKSGFGSNASPATGQ